MFPHMPSVRKTKTTSGSFAIQVVRYERRKTIVMKHIGSGKTEEEISALMESARCWIERETGQRSLFPRSSQRTLPLATLRYEGVQHRFAYETLASVGTRMGFSEMRTPILFDLAILRCIHPCSKLRSRDLLSQSFGIHHSEHALYRTLQTLHMKKEEAENIAVAWAKKHVSSDLSLVLYDVTTLYFETFESDDLRVPGFSKDNKSNQPQIVIGLLVTREGFPLGYEVFKGNTFEGKTMFPVLDDFVKKHRIATPVVVADAAMLSRTNIAEFEKRNLSYIVGARLANLSPTFIEKFGDLQGKDGAVARFETKHGKLLVSFSERRFRKDSAEMEKQKTKAELLVTKGEPGKRAKFVIKGKGKEAYAFDEALLEKTKKLLGLKGYATNIPSHILSDEEIISRYHDLWHVEASFRMAKSDLATRPVFHRKEEAIRAHMVLCFIALSIGRWCEIATGLSLRRIADKLWSVTEARIVDTATGERFTLRSEADEETKNALKSLGVSY